MNAVKIMAIVLIMAGVLGLVYGRFSYAKAGCFMRAVVAASRSATGR